MADLTKYDLRLNGVNQDTNYVKQCAYRLSGTFTPSILLGAAHDVVAIPAGEMLVGLRIVSLSSASSDGNCSMDFKIKVGENTAEKVRSTAFTVNDFAKGKVFNLPVAGVAGYDVEKGSVIQFVPTVALTALDLILVVETVPVLEFLTQG